MLTLTRVTAKEDISDELPLEKLTTTGNEADEDAKEELFEEDLYVWNLLLLADKKD